MFVVLGVNSYKINISEIDLTPQKAMQCCHQSDYTDWTVYTGNCSRWLCNGCRIKLNVAANSIWFCPDHVDMHSDQDENNDQ